MPWYYALLLGMVQALTEFLPVSSSGHLAVIQHLFQIPQASATFDALLHLGTALATICYYFSRIRTLGIGCRQWTRHRLGHLETLDGESAASVHLTAMILLSTAVTAILALPLKGFFESLFDKPAWVAIAFLITATILLLTRKERAGARGQGLERITVKVAILIGVAQFVAVTPGISRSGVTIALALLLGLKRNAAAEFSFLISIPAILGASLILFLQGGVNAGWGALALGVITSFVFGLLALSLLVRLVKKGKFYLFSYYLFPLGVLVLLVSLIG